MEESKIPMLASAWYGVMLPANAPPDVVARLNTEFAKILNTPEMRLRLQNIGAEVGGGTAQEFKTYVSSEINRYESLVKLSGAPKE
jgi:tripartite-type tricarboxylate transporter receptor subunit TctC